MIIIMDNLGGWMDGRKWRTVDDCSSSFRLSSSLTPVGNHAVSSSSCLSVGNCHEAVVEQSSIAISLSLTTPPGLLVFEQASRKLSLSSGSQWLILITHLLYLSIYPFALSSHHLHYSDSVLILLSPSLSFSFFFFCCLIQLLFSAPSSVLQLVDLLSHPLPGPSSYSIYVLCC
ncbi:hypothetical protein BJX70DRAFT_197512 [Aspergillus crustosus]